MNRRFRITIAATSVIMGAALGASQVFATSGASAPPSAPGLFAAYLTQLTTKFSQKQIMSIAHTGAIRGRALPTEVQLTAQTPLNAVASVASSAGTVVGKVFVGGGPALMGQPKVTQSRRATVKVLSGSHVVATAKTTSGQFRARVRPGRYLLTATIPPHVVCQRRYVIVRAGRTIRTSLGCSTK